MRIQYDENLGLYNFSFSITKEAIDDLKSINCLDSYENLVKIVREQFEEELKNLGVNK